MPPPPMMTCNESANNGNVVPDRAIASTMSTTDRKDATSGPALTQKRPSRMQQNSYAVKLQPTTQLY